jgi:hypothetical protein
MTVRNSRACPNSTGHPTSATGRGRDCAPPCDGPHALRVIPILAEQASRGGSSQAHLFWLVWQEETTRSPNLQFASFDELFTIYAKHFLTNGGKPARHRSLRRLLESDSVHWSHDYVRRRRRRLWRIRSRRKVAQTLLKPNQSTGEQYVSQMCEVPLQEARGGLRHRNAVMLGWSLTRDATRPRSQSLIAEQNGVSKRQVQAVCRYLMEHGQITIQRNEIDVPLGNATGTEEGRQQALPEAVAISRGLTRTCGGRLFYVRRVGSGYAVMTPTVNEYHRVERGHPSRAPRSALRRLRRDLRKSACRRRVEHAISRAGTRNDEARARHRSRSNHELLRPESGALVVSASQGRRMSGRASFLWGSHGPAKDWMNHALAGLAGQ